MSEVTIREAVDGDIAAILDLYVAAGIAEASFSVDEGREHLARLREYPSYRVFVAVTDGVLVGTYELLIMDNLAKRGAKSGVVEDVAVDPRMQGRGIGRAMMLHAMERCREAGCYKLALSSNAKREEAHRFYESLGFERHGYSFRVEIGS
jgi:GNAT superfamily N-acetyltransferase